MYTTLGGRVTCTQCSAKSKRSGERCRNPAVKGFSVCRFHGARGGPKTAQGRANIAKAHTTHGDETRLKRIESSMKKSEFRYIEELMFNIGMMAPGTERTRGPKPKHMSDKAIAWALLNEDVKKYGAWAVNEAIENILDINASD